MRIKKNSVIILCVLLLAAQTGCGAPGGNDKGSQGIRPTETSGVYTEMEPTGTLRIASVYFDSSSNVLKEAIRIFNIKYPMWDVVVENEGEKSRESGDGGAFIVRNDPEAETRYYNELPDRVRDGEAPDIITMEDADIERLVRENLLEDLMPLINADERFSFDMLLPGVLMAMNYERGLYYMPVSFTFDALMLWQSDRTAVSGELASRERPDPWNWESATAFFTPEMLRTEEEYLLPMPPQTFVRFLLGKYYTYLYNEGTETFDFDSVVFKDLMFTAYDLHKKGLLWSADFQGEFIYGYPSMLILTSYFSEPIKDFNTFQTTRGSYYPLPEVEGAEGIAIQPTDLFAINANAREKTAAWEFMKILWSDELQNDLAAGHSILANLNEDGVKKAVGLPSFMKITETEVLNYNNERFLFFSNINRVESLDKMGFILGYLNEQMIKFFMDELTLPEVIENLNNYAKAQP